MNREFQEVKNAIAKNYENVKIGNGNSDQTEAAKVLSASIAQGTYVMGFQSMNFLYQLQHELTNPIDGWKNKGINLLPTFVDTGVSIVTKENLKSFYND